MDKEVTIIKNVIVTFDFDPATESVTNVQCSVDGVEKKKRTTRKKSEVEEELAATPLITVEPNKLIFNNKAVADMQLEYEDRIVIKWEPVAPKSKSMIPIIGKDIAFDEEGSGNKVTKSFTVGYKGKQNAILADLDTSFTIEPYKEGIWKLIPTKDPSSVKTIKEAITISEKVEPILITEDEEESIEEIKFQFTI